MSKARRDNAGGAALRQDEEDIEVEAPYRQHYQDDDEMDGIS